MSNAVVRDTQKTTTATGFVEECRETRLVTRRIYTVERDFDDVLIRSRIDGYDSPNAIVVRIPHDQAEHIADLMRDAAREIAADAGSPQALPGYEPPADPDPINHHPV